MRKPICRRAAPTAASTVAVIKLEATEQSRRHIEGTLNGGGVAIELRTTNGGIRVRSRSAESDVQMDRIEDCRATQDLAAQSGVSRRTVAR